MSAMDEIPCLIIAPLEKSEKTFNLNMMELFGAKILTTPVENVKSKIDNVLKKLQEEGYAPYFIMGGGHGNIGTQAYVDVYEEIEKYENENGFKFDFIFHASGTGTTQAGLVCGQLLAKETNRRIVGISIARKKPYGRDVVVQSVKDYLMMIHKEELLEEKYIEFVDDYIEGGYGVKSGVVDKYIKMMLLKEGIPLDRTYTAKAFAGMFEYLQRNGIEKKNVLFIHTGGGPLFFDYLNNTNRMV